MSPALRSHNIQFSCCRACGRDYIEQLPLPSGRRLMLCTTCRLSRRKDRPVKAEAEGPYLERSSDEYRDESSPSEL